MVSLPIARTATLERPRTSSGLTALLLWIALNAADALITWYSFGVGAAEGNPLLVSVQQALGAGPMLLTKVAASIMVGVAVWWWGCHRILRALDWLMLIVVAYNLGVVRYLLG